MRMRDTISLAVLVGVLWPTTVGAQVCETLVEGDRVRLDVEAPFLGRLWVKKDLLKAIFSQTVPVRGFFGYATADSLWMTGHVEASEPQLLQIDAESLSLTEVRRIRKRCHGDPIWDGAVGGAVTAAGPVFVMDLLLTFGWLLFDTPAFPILHADPEWYMVMGGLGLLVGGLLDLAAPGWVDVEVSTAGSSGRLSLGIWVGVP